MTAFFFHGQVESCQRRAMSLHLVHGESRRRQEHRASLVCDGSSASACHQLAEPDGYPTASASLAVPAILTVRGDWKAMRPPIRRLGGRRPRDVPEHGLEFALD